jgi:hypothetical protein
VWLSEVRVHTACDIDLPLGRRNSIVTCNLILEKETKRAEGGVEEVEVWRWRCGGGGVEVEAWRAGEDCRELK